MSTIYWTQNNCELHRPLQVDTWEEGEDRKTIAQRERKHNHFCVLYDVKQVQAAVESQRTAVSSKCFKIYYTCSDRLLTIALPPCSLHLFSPLTVTFPKLSVILRPLYTPKFCTYFFFVSTYDVQIQFTSRALTSIPEQYNATHRHQEVPGYVIITLSPLHSARFGSTYSQSVIPYTEAVYTNSCIQ
jgi:hypothetical protein